MKGVCKIKILRVLLAALLILQCSTMFQICSFGVTVNEIRYIFNQQMMDNGDIQNSDYTTDNIAEIHKNIELVSIAKEQGLPICMDKEVNEAIEDVKRAVFQKSDEYYKLIVTGEKVKDIFRVKTELESVLNEADKLEKSGKDLNMPVIDSKYFELKAKIEREIEQYNTNIDIGEIGENLKPPLTSDLEIVSIFGDNNYGLGIQTKKGEYILSQWDGVVAGKYSSVNQGNIIEIQHGNGLTTRYINVGDMYITEGEIVKQYDIIGVSNTYPETTSLCFEVWLDNKAINPILIYGSKGIEAYNAYVKNENRENYTYSNSDSKPRESQTETKDRENNAQNNNDTENKKYEFGFYTIIPKVYDMEYEDLPPDVIVPKLPDNYQRPEPGIIN